MPFIDDEDVVRFTLTTPDDEGQWVDLKRRFNKTDEVANTIAAAKGARKVGGEFEPDLEQALPGITFGAAIRCIKAWSWPRPVTPENIGKLAGETFDAIQAEIDRLNPKRTDEEKNALSSTSSQPSAAADTGRPKLDTSR